MSLVVGIGAYAAVGLGVDGSCRSTSIAYGALAGRARRRLPRRGPHASRRTPTRSLLPIVLGAQRARPGDDPPHRPGQPAHDPDATHLRRHPADLDDARRGPVRRPCSCVLRDHRRLQAFTYTAGLAAHRAAAAAAAARASARRSTAPASGSASARSASSPARSPRCCWWSPSPATSCCTATPWRWPGGGSWASTCPAAATSGPILAMWLVSLGILVFQRDLGSSLLFFGLFLVMLYVATERPGWLVVGGMHVRSRAPTSATCALSHVQTRVRRLARPVRPGRRTPTRSSQGLYGMALGRARRPRARPGRPGRSRSPTPTSSSPRSARSSASPG